MSHLDSLIVLTFLCFQDTCKSCNGVGTVQKLKELDVDFPPGRLSANIQSGAKRNSAANIIERVSFL